MQSACQISAYAHYARTPVVQLKQRTDDTPFDLNSRTCAINADWRLPVTGSFTGLELLLAIRMSQT